MLLITGPGRCGTSILAYFCLHIGHDPGGVWDAASNSGMEDPQLKQLHQGILNKKIPREEVVLRISDYAQSRSVAKCCLFYRHPELHGSWQEAVPDLQVISLWRMPHAMAESWMKFPYTNKTKSWTAEQYRVWSLEREKAFGQSVDQLKIPVTYFQFPQYLTKPIPVLEALRRGGLQFDIGHALAWWERLMKQDMVHHPCESPASVPPITPGLRVWSRIRSLASRLRPTKTPS